MASNSVKAKSQDMPMPIEAAQGKTSGKLNIPAVLGYGVKTIRSCKGNKSIAECHT
jgi:hypothetical protein